MTFQELVDKRGIMGVFSSTGVDLATQNCILEWCFDYELSDDDPEIWLRYFRRRCLEIYPRYSELVRIMSVKTNMDPFIQVFMQRVHKSSDMKDMSFVESKNGNTGEISVVAVAKDGSKIENDNKKVVHHFTDYEEIHDYGQNGVTHTDTYDDYHEITNKTAMGQSTDRVRGTDTDNFTRTDAVTTSGEGRNINIAYPEANMGSIPNGVASEGGATSNIAYAAAESRSFTKNTTPVTKTYENKDVKTESDYGDVDSSDKSITGSHEVKDMGQEHFSKQGEYYDQNSGGTTSITSDEQTQNKTSAISNTDSKTNFSSGSSEGELQIAEQGRTESPADILPRAVNAIISSDEIKFLITGLMPCFDCYGRI